MQSSSRKLLAVAALFALALAVRLFHLDHQSLWHDEAFTILASRKDWGGMIRDLVVDFNHPPLHYVLVHLAFGALDVSPFVARLPSAILGAAAIPVLYLLGRRLYPGATGLVASLLLLFSQQALVFSQTARGYSQLLFFSVAAMHLYLVALQDRSRAAWYGAVVCATLALYSHFYASFVVAACLLFLLATHRRHSLSISWMVGGVLLALGAAVPWLLSGVLEEARSGPATTFMEQSVWRRSSWRSLPDTVDAFGNGRVAGIYEDSPVWSILAAGLLFAVPALLAARSLLRRGDPDRDATLFLLLMSALPIFTAWALGHAGLAYRPRYVAFALPPYYLLVARGLLSISAPRLRAACLAACLVFAVFAAHAALALPYRANYRDGLATVADAWRDGDGLVFSPWGEPRQWELYREDHPALVTRPFPDVADGDTDAQRVWLVTYLKPGARGRAYRHLEAFDEHWSLEERHAFYRVVVGLYVPRP